jgi:hypothetical protein
LIIGTLSGRLVTFSKQGLGFWTNLGLGEIKITFEDLISACVGSLLCVGAWWLIRKRAAPKTPEVKPDFLRLPAMISSLHGLQETLLLTD